MTKMVKLLRKLLRKEADIIWSWLQPQVTSEDIEWLKPHWQGRWELKESEIGRGRTEL